MRRWREGLRQVEQMRRQEWALMSDAQRLRALQQMYDFARYLGLHAPSVQPTDDKWRRIKRRWLQMNPQYNPNFFVS